MSWSYSAHNCFQRCKRQYYYRHIAAHHNAKKDPLRKEAHFLNQLTPSSFWAGNLVEAGIEDVAVNGNANPENIVSRLLRYTRKLADDQLRFSLNNEYRKETKSNIGRRYFRLFEHEYGMDDSGVLDSALRDAAICYNNFPSMIVPDLDRSLMDLIASESTTRCQQPVPLKLFDSTIQCILDCLIPLGKKIVVIDWKVSKTSASNFEKQLKTYGMAIYHSSWRSDRNLEDIHVYEVNFYSGQIVRYPLDRNAMDETEDFIFDSIKRIQALVQNKKFIGLDVEDFPMCENLTVCQYCNFQKLCIQ